RGWCTPRPGRRWCARRPRAGPRRSTWSRTAGARSAWTCRRPPSPRWRTAGCPSIWWPLEVALLLAVFHRGLTRPVVGPGLAALGDPGGRDLLDHRVQGRRRRLHRAGAGRVAHGAVAHGRLERRLVVLPVGVR